MPSKILVVTGSTDGSAGSYLQESNEKFTKDDNTWEAVWDGCIWSLNQKRVTITLSCPDDDAAADELFGNTFLRSPKTGDPAFASTLGFGSLSDKTDNPDVCAVAASSDKDYCAIKSFGAVCALVERFDNETFP